MAAMVPLHPTVMADMVDPVVTVVVGDMEEAAVEEDMMVAVAVAMEDEVMVVMVEAVVVVVEVTVVVAADMEEVVAEEIEVCKINLRINLSGIRLFA